MKEFNLLMKEMPVVAVARKVGEHGTRQWWVFHYYVDWAMNQMDFIVSIQPIVTKFQTLNCISFPRYLTYIDTG
jgi:hypothetical protein